MFYFSVNVLIASISTATILYGPSTVIIKTPNNIHMTPDVALVFFHQVNHQVALMLSHLSHFVVSVIRASSFEAGRFFLRASEAHYGIPQACGESPPSAANRILEQSTRSLAIF